MQQLLTVVNWSDILWRERKIEDDAEIALTQLIRAIELEQTKTEDERDRRIAVEDDYDALVDELDGLREEHDELEENHRRVRENVEEEIREEVQGGISDMKKRIEELEAEIELIKDLYTHMGV